jgi:hypothetical protein
MLTCTSFWPRVSRHDLRASRWSWRSTTAPMIPATF